MKDPSLQIDPYLFEKHFEEFIRFAEEKASVKFMSFSSHPYTEYHEGYKYDLGFKLQVQHHLVRKTPFQVF